MSEPEQHSLAELEALAFHSDGRPGKIEIVATKPMATQSDLALGAIARGFRQISPDTRSVEGSNQPRRLAESAPARRNSMTEEALLKSAQRLTRMLGIGPSVATTVVDHIPGQPGEITFLVLRHNSYQMPPVPTRFEGNIVRIKIDGVERERSGPRYPGH